MTEKHPVIIGDELRTTAKELPVINPFDNSIAGVTYLCGTTELNHALSAATAAFDKLKKYSSYQRADILQRCVDGIKKRSEELARTIALEAGKPIKDARSEVARATNTFQIALEESKRLGGEVMPLDISHGAEGRFAIIRRFPIGVVLGITPFNFPLNLVAHKIAPAMACGSPIIIKPASKTPLTALALGEIILDSGYAKGGVSIVPSAAGDVEKLLEDARIKKLTFTGSPAVGWRLKSKAINKRVTLELGGNAGVIIHEDADLDYAAKQCAKGAFSYAGQVCISVQRVYAHKNIFNEFKKKFLKLASALKLGNPLDESTDIGPMIDTASVEKTEAWVNEAIKGGAKLLTGGKRRGPCFEPTVLTNTTSSMKVCSEEIFGPVVALESYENFEDALKQINQGRFGLQAGLFTKDMGRILLAYETLEVGGVIANDVPTFRMDNMPYGGIKESGFGREGVRYAIEEMTELKLLAIKA
ncbi:aldehyde dehydrogenase family protein [bacterium]|nr:MAG: aldehyde dehydrogenase family protein [bacterium]